MSEASQLGDGMERTNICDRCGDEYDRYYVMIRDNFSEIAAMASCEWDNLCKPCRMVVTDYGAYLNKTELKELEPKQTVGSGNEHSKEGSHDV